MIRGGDGAFEKDSSYFLFKKKKKGQNDTRYIYISASPIRVIRTAVDRAFRFNPPEISYRPLTPN